MLLKVMSTMPIRLNYLNINLKLHLSIVYLNPVFSLYYIVVFNKQKGTAFVADGGSPGQFFWPKGSFYFKIVRWFGAH